MNEVHDVAPSDDQDIADQVDGFFKPLMQDGAILMLRLLTAAALGIAVSVTSVAAIAESSVAVSPEVQEQGFLSSAKDYGSRVFSSARENVGKIFDDDERVRLLKQKEELYQQRISDLNRQLIERDLELNIKHKSLAMCARDVADYLDELSVQKEVQ